MRKDRFVFSRGIANVLHYLGQHVLSLMVIYFCLRLTNAPAMITSTLAWALYMTIGYNMGRADVTVLEESRAAHDLERARIRKDLAPLLEDEIRRRT